MNITSSIAHLLKSSVFWHCFNQVINYLFLCELLVIIPLSAPVMSSKSSRTPAATKKNHVRSAMFIGCMHQFLHSVITAFQFIFLTNGTRNSKPGDFFTPRKLLMRFMNNVDLPRKPFIQSFDGRAFRKSSNLLWSLWVWFRRQALPIGRQIGWWEFGVSWVGVAILGLLGWGVFGVISIFSLSESISVTCNVLKLNHRQKN